MVSEFQRLRGAGTPRVGQRRDDLSPLVAAARRKEKMRRATETRRRALLVLAHRHPEEYAEIRASEKAALDVECGPLPGDESP